MKSDLPRLMQERNLDALVVFGVDGLGAANTAFTYFTGDAHVSQGLIVLTRDGDQLRQHLVHRNMERDEAAKTGMNLLSHERFDMPALIQAAGGDRRKAQTAWMRRVFAEVGVTGRVGFYGADSVGRSFTLLNDLIREEICEVVVEHENDVMTAARATKDAHEAGLIKQACALTEGVIGLTRDLLRAAPVREGALLRADGGWLTVGDVKKFIRIRAIEAGLDYKDCIFSIGRDSGIGHSIGNPADVIQQGRTIVFDIYPPGPGGYHSDITRTWCLGYAPDHVLAGYETVMRAHAAGEAAIKLGALTHDAHAAVCDIFEAAGHSTNRTDFKSNNGFYHSLGHGFGLDVHEAPYMAVRGMRADEFFQKGTIICNEPGLYYPDDARGGWGIRIEDDYWIDEDGVTTRLTEFDRSLVI
jgi:Xaa-Pro aminopeptidase